MFWDSSALVSILLREPKSPEFVDRFERDRNPAIWWATRLECHSALARHARERRTKRETILEGIERLRDVHARAFELAPSEEVRHRAIRLLNVYPLRAGDALQLAAALTWCEEQPLNEMFVCLDTRLREAARREGFSVLPE